MRVEWVFIPEILVLGCDVVYDTINGERAFEDRRLAKSGVALTVHNNTRPAKLSASGIHDVCEILSETI